jgi:hypothetical protein
MKKPRPPILQPITVEITPRLLAAVEASIGRKITPGCQIIVNPPPPIKALHPGLTCHLCGAKDYDCPHIPGVPF